VVALLRGGEIGTARSPGATMRRPVKRQTARMVVATCGIDTCLEVFD